MNVLSMGGGVQTTAMLLQYSTTYDHVIFADTGDERPGTYQYIEQYLKPYCKAHGIEWHTVRHNKYDSLMEYCIDKRTVPVMVTRWCTREFKIRPIERMLLKLGATRKNPARLHVGISIDESHRLGSGAYVNKPKYRIKVYPLIEDRISREDCHRIIAACGWPQPEKSGCDFCPYRPYRELMGIRAENPERFAQIIKMEKGDRKGRPLKHHGRHLQLNEMLDTYDDNDDQTESQCGSGHCFN